MMSEMQSCNEKRLRKNDISDDDEAMILAYDINPVLYRVDFALSSVIV